MNKQKKMAFLMAVLMLVSVFSFSSCGKKDKKEPAKKDEATFTVGFDADFPPYGYKADDGEYKGFDLDLAREVCKRNGWKFKAQPIDWDTKNMELDSGTIDCIWNGFTMNGREDQYTFTKPYIDNSQVVVVKADSGITSLDDLAGKVVAVQTDSSAEAVLEGPKKALRDTFKDLDVQKEYNTCFQQLESGSVDAIAMDIAVANYQLEKRGTENFVKLEQVLAKEEYAVAFKKGNTKLRDKVQKTLDAMMEDGTFQKIAKKWGVSDMIITPETKDEKAESQSNMSQADAEAIKEAQAE